LATSAWDSTKCYLTWKTSVTPRNRLLFQLVPSEPGIDVTGCGLLPTLTVSGNSNQSGASKKSADGLRTRLVGLMPTLLAADAKGGIYKKPQGGPSLRTFLPTLMSADAKQVQANKRGNLSLGSTLLAEGFPVTDAEGNPLKSSTLSGPLNPRWCEFFMGYPRDHTALKDSATRSSPKSRNRSSASSRKLKEAK
jgi:hypothetical protein